MDGMLPRGRVRQALAHMSRAVVDRIMRWRGHPPELAGVREPRRPRPTLPAASVALAEPRTRPRLLRWLRLRGNRYRPGAAPRGQRRPRLLKRRTRAGNPEPF